MATDQDPGDGGLLAEALVVPERLVVAPAAGVFWSRPPGELTSEGGLVRAGEVLGTVHGTGAPVAVVSPHTGLLMGQLAADGERVRAAQPVAWLRSFDP